MKAVDYYFYFLQNLGLSSIFLSIAPSDLQLHKRGIYKPRDFYTYQDLLDTYHSLKIAWSRWRIERNGKMSTLLLHMKSFPHGMHVKSFTASRAWQDFYMKYLAASHAWKKRFPCGIHVKWSHADSLHVPEHGSPSWEEPAPTGSRTEDSETWLGHLFSWTT